MFFCLYSEKLHQLPRGKEQDDDISEKSSSANSSVEEDTGVWVDHKPGLEAQAASLKAKEPITIVGENGQITEVVYDNLFEKR